MSGYCYGEQSGTDAGAAVALCLRQQQRRPERRFVTAVVLSCWLKLHGMSACWTLFVAWQRSAAARSSHCNGHAHKLRCVHSAGPDGNLYPAMYGAQVGLLCRVSAVGLGLAEQPHVHSSAPRHRALAPSLQLQPFSRSAFSWGPGVSTQHEAAPCLC